MESPFTGGCLCERVRFAITGPLGPAGYCHCTRCQRRSGTAASAQARIDGNSLHLTEGADLLRAYRPTTGFEKLFCSQCGSSLFSRSPADPAKMSVRLGAFDEDPGVRPSWRQFVAYAARWEQIPDDGLPRFEESTPGSWADPLSPVV